VTGGQAVCDSAVPNNPQLRIVWSFENNAGFSLVQGEVMSEQGIESLTVGFFSLMIIIIAIIIRLMLSRRK